jgi:hypothetical protein
MVATPGSLFDASPHPVKLSPIGAQSKCVQLPSHSLDGKKTVLSGINRESSLFSSSLSEIFSRKCKLSFFFFLKLGA